MSFTNIIPPWHRTFMDGLSIPFAPNPDVIDGEYGGTYKPPAPPAQPVITSSSTRACRFCQTVQQCGQACNNCGAPEYTSPEHRSTMPLQQAPFRVFTG